MRGIDKELHEPLYVLGVVLLKVHIPKIRHQYFAARRHLQRIG